MKLKKEDKLSIPKSIEVIFTPITIGLLFASILCGVIVGVYALFVGISSEIFNVFKVVAFSVYVCVGITLNAYTLIEDGDINTRVGLKLSIIIIIINTILISLMLFVINI